jgi:2-polyprenyl-3-methyl-5-hydroxy-6-metoxy-1,4-benzoquinol methylase
MDLDRMLDARHKEILKIGIFLSKASQAEKERYLDLGCGDRELTREVAWLFNAKEVYCVDRDEASVIKAKERGIKIVLADLEIDQLSFAGDYFDVVTAFDVIEYLKNPYNMLSELIEFSKTKDYLYYQRLTLRVG